LTTAPARADLDLPPELLEELARGEHGRWARDLKSKGWRYTEGSKDATGKRHPLLVPWEELPEPEREKDRDAVRGLPRMLSMVGYELVLPEERPHGQS
jgi:hypothetical protein